jgi:peptidyl-prolyl cis-trans isomerase A (cyclophilin A)
MAYWVTMRGINGLILGAAACLALAGCSSPSREEAKKAEAPAAAKSDKAPDVFTVNLDTSKGPVAIEVHRDWAPIGADHFYSLVKTGFFNNARFFRVVRDFVVQFGIAADPKTNALWESAELKDDPVKQHNVRGTLVFATRGPNTRTTQMFINLKDNTADLDGQGFAPIGDVISGMDVVERFYSSYGDMPPMGSGPDPQQISSRGNEYLESRFPRLDYIKKAAIQ